MLELNDEDLASQLGAATSSLYGTIDIDGKTYKIPYVNGLPSENMELIKAGDKVDAVIKNGDDFTWLEQSEIFGNFGAEVLKKLNPELPEREARILSVKGNAIRMYTIWGKS